MIKFVETARDLVLSKPDEKIMVHCSAGVGRTGTLIALTNLIGEAKGADKNRRLSVFRTVRLLREQRMNMVERFVHFID